MKQARIKGIPLNEVLYADDTVCITNDVESMNMYLKEVEIESARRGLRLNRGKRELMKLGNWTPGTVAFSDGTKVPVKEEVKYLGCFLNDRGDPRLEVKKRMATCMTTWRRLGEFWKGSNCSVRIKVQVYDAVIRAKLLYGLESAQLNDSLLKWINAFHLRGLRQILKIPTTYVE